MSKEARDRKRLDEIYGAFFAGEFENWMGYWDENSVIREAESLPYGGDHRGSRTNSSARRTNGSIMGGIQY